MFGSTGSAYWSPWKAPAAERRRHEVRHVVPLQPLVERRRRNSDSGGIHGSSMNTASYRPAAAERQQLLLVQVAERRRVDQRP